jgi:hypothetical protein
MLKGTEAGIRLQVGKLPKKPTNRDLPIFGLQTTDVNFEIRAKNKHCQKIMCSLTLTFFVAENKKRLIILGLNFDRNMWT